MYRLLSIFSCLMVVALAKPQHHLPAAQYPAGVNPQDCPGFPVCDNARLHNPAARWQSAPAWQPQPQWAASNWQHSSGAWNAPAPAHSWAAPASTAGGDKFPAGVNPHTCPNYPFCDVHAGGAAAPAPPLPGWTERQYPAGVSPHTCPNFPYCH